MAQKVEVIRPEPSGPGGSGGGSRGGSSRGWKDKFKSQFKRVVLMVLAILVVIGLLFNSLFVYVEPNEFGIQEKKLGSNKGVQKEVYTCGLYFVPWFLRKMHTLPRDIQVLEMSGNYETTAKNARVERVAHIQTSDGFFVDVDVSILYRIEDPYLVITTIGPGTLFEDNGIIPKTEPVLKETLGQLTTEDFYNSHKRVEKVALAKEKLNIELKPKGLVVDQVLVRYFSYSSEIQKNIEEKKLKDQLVFKNIAEGQAEREGAKLKKMIEEGEAALKVKLEEGQAYVTTKMAEKDLYVRKKKAAADLMVKLAEANATELRNAALQGAGSDRMVGLKMAEVLQGLEVVILSSDGDAGVNPLDLDGLMKMFEVRGGNDRNRNAPSSMDYDEGGVQ